MKCIACNKNKFEKFTSSAGYDFLRCKNCELVQMAKIPTAKELNEIYSYKGVTGVAKSNVALDLFFKVPLFRKMMHMQGEMINLLRSQGTIIEAVREGEPHKYLLDIGTGPGTFIKYVKTTGWQVFGTEMGDKLVTKLRKQFGKDSIYKGEVQDIKFGKNKFDIVTLWHVFEHMPNVNEVLAKIKTLLKEEGELIIEVPHANSLSFKLFKDNWTLLMSPQHLHIWSEKSLREILKKNGFTVTKVVQPPHFGFILFSSLVKVNRLFLVLTPVLIPLSFLWTFITSMMGSGDVIRVYSNLK